MLSSVRRCNHASLWWPKSIVSVAIVSRGVVILVKLLIINLIVECALRNHPRLSCLLYILSADAFHFLYSLRIVSSWSLRVICLLHEFLDQLAECSFRWHWSLFVVVQLVRESVHHEVIGHVLHRTSYDVLVLVGVATLAKV